MAIDTRFVQGLSVRHKLAFLALLSSATALLVAAVIFIVYQVGVCRRELVHDVATVTSLVAENVHRAVAANDPAAVQAVLAGLREDTHVVLATVYGPGGESLASFRREATQSPPVRPPRLDGFSFQDGYLAGSEPVLGAEGQRLGSVYARASLEGLYQRMAEQIGIGALVMLGALLVAWVVSRRVQQAILQPLAQLTDGVRAFAQDQPLCLDAGERCRDEIGLLFGAFEEMREQIQRRDTAVRHSEQYYRSLIENATDITLLLDAGGTITQVSPSVEHMMDYGVEELLRGRSLLSLVHTKDAPAVEHALRAAVEDREEPFAVEFRCRLSERGEPWRVLEGRGRNLLGDPAVDSIVLNCRDITERNATEQALRESEVRFRQVVEHAADAFLLHDAQGRILDVNQRACDTLGYTREELLEMAVPDIEGNFVTEGQGGAWEQMQPGEPITIQGVHRRKDGGTFPVEVRVGLFESGGRTLMVALARDMTERERAAAELSQAKEAAEAAARAKSRFLANMSHEIRTPMNAVLGMSQLLRHTPLSPEQRHYVQIIESSEQALLRLIEDILDMSKIEAGKLELQEEGFDLARVVEDALDMVAQRAHERSLQLAAYLDPGVPTALIGNPGRIRQILLNLLANAIDFTEQGEVWVQVEPAPAQAGAVGVRFTVRDTGPGIAPELHPQLFKPFVQGDSPARRAHGGTGLGLAICRSLVQMMDGRIDVDSEPGRGSSFWFEIRLQAQAHQPEAPVPAAPGTRVLVVDDNRTAGSLLAATLQDWGLETALAAGGERALDVLRRAAAGEQPVDVTLIDARMPGMDGLTLAHAIRSDETIAAARIILTSPLEQPLAASALAEAGIGAQVARPVRRDALAAALKKAMEAPLPATQAAQEAAPQRPAPRTRRGSPRILVAEDNPVNQEVMVLLLEQLGCAVDTVRNGVQALEALQKLAYDLVLMDCQMPEMDGYEAAAAIRAGESEGTGTVIVAVTAHALAANRERCMEAGMDDFLIKPVTESKLREVIGRWQPHEQESKDNIEPALDTQVLSALEELEAAGNPDFVARLAALFESDAPGRLTAMRAALQGRDLDALHKQAHAMKGGCRQIGARVMEALCVRIEQCCEAGEPKALRRMIDELERELERVRSELRRLRPAEA